MISDQNINTDKSDNDEKVLEEYEKQANQITSQIADVVSKVEKKVDEDKYNKVLEEIKKSS